MNPWSARRERARQQAAWDEGVAKALQRTEWMDERNERVIGIRSVRSPEAAERAGIRRLLHTYEYIHEQVDPGFTNFCIALTGYTPDELWDYKVEEAYAEQERVSVTIRPIRQDIIENCLYDEYLEQLNSKHPIRSWSVYATYMGARAVIKVLTEHMQEVSSTLGPSREDAIRFTQRLDYNPYDPVWFLSHVFTEVPGTFEAVQSLHEMYGDVVRTVSDATGQQYAGELPDDPIGNSVIDRYGTPEYMRLEQAIEAFLAEEGSADMVAAQYGIGQKRFRTILRERGLMRSHGGDRRGRN